MEPCFSADYPDQHGECEIGMKQWITRRNSRVVAALRWRPHPCGIVGSLWKLVNVLNGQCTALHSSCERGCQSVARSYLFAEC